MQYIFISRIFSHLHVEANKFLHYAKKNFPLQDQSRRTRKCYDSCEEKNLDISGSFFDQISEIAVFSGIQ
jgi:hypothetical protein